jgi:hypothetical protein
VLDSENDGSVKGFVDLQTLGGDGEGVEGNVWEVWGCGGLGILGCGA